jgi:hypothetical protein
VLATYTSLLLQPPLLQDADSLDTATGKKAEGAFYVWTADKVKSVLGDERASVFNNDALLLLSIAFFAGCRLIPHILRSPPLPC